MNTRYPSVPQIIGARPQFKYSAPWSDCRIIHEHDCMGTRLLIVGDPDCGCYEWVIIISGKVESHSNDGYGISEVALRDGLISAFKDCFGPPVNSSSPVASLPATSNGPEHTSRSPAADESPWYYFSKEEGIAMLVHVVAQSHQQHAAWQAARAAALREGTALPADVPPDVSTIRQRLRQLLVKIGFPMAQAEGPTPPGASESPPPAAAPCLPMSSSAQPSQPLSPDKSAA